MDEIASRHGAQCVVASIDVRTDPSVVAGSVSVTPGSSPQGARWVSGRASSKTGVRAKF